MEKTFSALILFMAFSCSYGSAPMQATELRMCDNRTNYLYQLHNIQLRMKDNIQEVKMKAVLGKDIDDENNYLIGVDRYIGTKLKRILNLKNKGACTAIVTYGGETFLNGLRQAKFPHPERCPMEKGSYVLDWYKVNFDTIPLVKLVPKGKFQLTIQSTDSKGKELLCVIINVEKN